MAAFRTFSVFRGNGSELVSNLIGASERAFAGKIPVSGGLHVIIPRENWRTTCFCHDSRGGLPTVGAVLRVPPVRFKFP